MHHAGDKGREKYRPEKRAAAVLLLKRRADDEDHHHVADIMRIAAVAEHVQEEARIGAEVGKGRTVHAEERVGALSAGEPVEPQYGKRQQRECQYDRRIILQLYELFAHAFASSAAIAES